MKVSMREELVMKSLEEGGTSDESLDELVFEEGETSLDERKSSKRLLRRISSIIIEIYKYR